jgi:thiol-disulfide isomerase/thioredoxin
MFLTLRYNLSKKRLTLKKIEIKKILKEIVIASVTLLLATNIISYLRAPTLQSSLLPDIKASFIDDKESLPQNRQKPLLIHIWATWCPTCKLEAGNIQTLSKYFDVITIAVKSGSDKEIKEYMSENGYNFKVINDSEGRVSAKFNVSVFPTTFIYNSKNRLEFTEVGYSSIIGLYLRMLLAS